MVGLDTGSVSSSVMHASSSTDAICTMMFHRTGSLSALKISVGGCGGMSSMVMMFPGQRESADWLPTVKCFIIVYQLGTLVPEGTLAALDLVSSWNGPGAGRAPARRRSRA